MKGPGILRSLFSFIDFSDYGFLQPIPLWLRLQPTPSGSASSLPPLAPPHTLHIFLRSIFSSQLCSPSPPPRSQPLNSMLFLSFFLFSFLSAFKKQTTNEKIFTQSKNIKKRNTETLTKKLTTTPISPRKPQKKQAIQGKLSTKYHGVPFVLAIDCWARSMPLSVDNVPHEI